MFRCGDKCTGKLAAEARLVREKVCYDNAAKEKDARMMKSSKRKIKNTKDYIKSMEDWPPSVNLAIGPALRVCRIRDDKKREAIKKQIEAVMETNIDPMTHKPLVNGQVTGAIIRYLIAKYDKKLYAKEKRFMLTDNNLQILMRLKSLCKEYPKEQKFVESLMVASR